MTLSPPSSCSWFSSVKQQAHASSYTFGQFLLIMTFLTLPNAFNILEKKGPYLVFVSKILEEIRKKSLNIYKNCFSKNTFILRGLVMLCMFSMFTGRKLFTLIFQCVWFFMLFRFNLLLFTFFMVSVLFSMLFIFNWMLFQFFVFITVFFVLYCG